MVRELILEFGKEKLVDERNDRRDVERALDGSVHSTQPVVQGLMQSLDQTSSRNMNPAHTFTFSLNSQRSGPFWLLNTICKNRQDAVKDNIHVKF